MNIITSLFLLLGFVFFYKTKTLNVRPLKKKQKLSIIVPARNEEINLPVLLSGLNKNKHLIHEIIVVNDCSEDNTVMVAKSFNAEVVNIDHQPEGWKGKNFACYTGAKKASGDLLLFLDSDLIPQKDMIEKLITNYQEGTVLSVQPYHYTEKAYEQFSLFFNIVAIAAVGVCLPGKDKSIGLFGPVLMMDKNLYFDFKGHKLVKNEVIEDYHLGILLRKKGIKCDLFLGFGCVDYQMYKNRFVDLIWGWSKNFAGAAAKTPPTFLFSVIVWLASYYSIAINFVGSIVLFFSGAGSVETTLLYVVLYLFAGIILFINSRKLGNFSLFSCIFYVIPLLVFTLIFMFSLILKFIIKKVKWKGRWHKV
ncbi:MAG: glycosyltransferase [Eubacteriaceae bacterium]